MGIAAGAFFLHTQNSYHLDQNIGLNKHKHSLLSTIILKNVMFLKKKETIHVGATGIKQTI